MSQLVVEVSKSRPVTYNVDTLRSQVEFFNSKGQRELAKRTLMKISITSPRFEDLLTLGEMEFEDQNFSQCVRLFERALENRGAELKGLNKLYRLMGAALIQLGQFESAEDYLYKALEYPGSSDGVLVNLGTLDIQRKNWESATISFREAIRVNSKNDKAWVGLALCHRFKGDHELALGNLELALDFAPKNETALGLLFAWYGEEKPQVIFKRLQSYLNLDGENQNLWLAFVELSFRAGFKDTAKLELERLRLTHPEFVPAYQLRIGS